MRKTQISAIEQALVQNQNFLNVKGVNLGVTGGTLGLSLFYYYYYLYTNEEKYIDKIMFHLNKAFEGINSDYQGYFIALDMIEIVQFLYFIKDKELIDDDINEYCQGFDEWIYKFLDIKVKEKELDPYGGIIKVGTYFLERSKDIEVTHIIDNILTLIEEWATTDGLKKEEISFNYNFLDKKCKEVGKGHGVAGIVFFLLQVHEKGFFKDRCKKIITPAIQFLLNRKLTKGTNLFPYNSDSTMTYEYSNLSYGDMGIGYTLYHAGRILNNETYSTQGIETMLNLSTFRDDKEEKIYDANLIYGAAGIYSLFRLFEEYHPNKAFTQASEYWLDRVMAFGTKNTKWAGYKTFYNGEQNELQLCFDQGICGIGITLICKELNILPDYLNFVNYNFI